MNNKSDKDIVIEYSQFLINLRKDFLKNYRQEFSQLTQYSQSLMNILGVIAGFGFTALQFVKTRIFFFSGEILVIFSIVFLVLKTKKYLAGQPAGTERWINDSVKKVREIKKSLIENDTSLIKDLADEFNRSVNDISADIPEIETAKELGRGLGVALVISIVGIVLILLSFTVYLCF